MTIASVPQRPSIPTAAGMTPAECVIDVFGGIRSVARAINVAPSTVLRWCKRSDGSAKAGWVPHEYVRPLLEAAARRRKRLTLEEVVWGRPGISRHVVTFLTASERPNAMSLMTMSLTGDDL